MRAWGEGSPENLQRKGHAQQLNKYGEKTPAPAEAPSGTSRGQTLQKGGAGPWLRGALEANPGKLPRGTEKVTEEVPQLVTGGSVGMWVLCFRLHKSPVSK